MLSIALICCMAVTAISLPAFAAIEDFGRDFYTSFEDFGEIAPGKYYKIRNLETKTDETSLFQFNNNDGTGSIAKDTYTGTHGAAAKITVENNPNVDIGGMVEIMLDAICSSREYLDINQDKVPKEIVKSRLLKLDSGHIDYVIECLQKNNTKIKNIRSYLLTTLYNSYETLDHYYRSEVNYDLYGQSQNP